MLGTEDKGSASGGSCVAKRFKSVEFIGEDVEAEEARLIHVAIACSVSSSRIESMLRTQSAGAGSSNFPEHFQGTWDPQPSKPFAGFPPTVNLELMVLVKGKFCLGTVLVGGLSPL